jgi:hypothetical protein
MPKAKLIAAVLVSISALGLSSALFHDHSLQALVSTLEVREFADQSVRLSVEGLAARGKSPASGALRDVEQVSKVQGTLNKVTRRAVESHRWQIGLWIGLLVLQFLLLPLCWKRQVESAAPR